MVSWETVVDKMELFELVAVKQHGGIAQECVVLEHTDSVEVTDLGNGVQIRLHLGYVDQLREALLFRELEDLFLCVARFICQYLRKHLLVSVKIFELGSLHMFFGGSWLLNDLLLFLLDDLNSVLGFLNFGLDSLLVEGFFVVLVGCLELYFLWLGSWSWFGLLMLLLRLWVTHLLNRCCLWLPSLGLGLFDLLDIVCLHVSSSHDVFHHF